ncbi:MAG: VCBS repeat-containing protein [Acidobacteria bacterium]|nr:VCBS repeat-containing protein [Acidobacteriota bacterium]
MFTRIVLLIALAFAAVISCSSAAGDRNWAFGTNGVRKTTFATSGSATAGVFQPDGKFLVIGWQFRSGTGTDFRIVRVGANGALDSSFGSNGVAFVAVSTRDDQALGIALQSDGKIIVVGSSRNSTAISDFAIVRLNENGSLDTSFGINGVAVTSVRPFDDIAYDVTIQVDGKIVVCGESGNNGTKTFGLVRYLTNGTLDTAFSDDGITTVDFPGGPSTCSAVRIQTENKIVATGNVGFGDFSASGFGFVRLNIDGSVDSTFGADGTRIVEVRNSTRRQNAPNDLLILPDGRILAAGSTLSDSPDSFDFAATRLTPDGSLDSSFASSGLLIVPFSGSATDGANTILPLPDGSFFLGGYANGGANLDFALARFSPNGTTDLRFGVNGRVVTPLTDQAELIHALRLDESGRILAGGMNNFETTMISYQNNGLRDFDFDGDKISDISIFRPSNGQWWLNRSTAGTITHTFGNSADVLTPGDFTGDGKTDVAIFRPSNGEWFVLRSEDFSFYSFPFGASNDIPVPADYDGDGKTDAAVFRPSDATWYIQRSSGGTTIQTFGAATDFPVPADYDGDGKTDIAIFRPSNGQWWLNRSTAGLIVHTFGTSTDKNIQGDYTGDGKTDVAIFRPSTGEWFVLRSEDASFYSFPFGANGDLPAPGDYDGDGKTDAAVFRPSSATWYLQRSTAGLLIQNFGASTDVPVPNVVVRP